MIQLLDLFGFISVLLRGLILASEAVTVGGVIFCFVIARPAEVHLRCRLTRLLTWSCALLACAELCYIAANSAILASTAQMSWAEISGATFWIAGVLVVSGALWILVSARADWGWRIAEASSYISCLFILAGSVMSSHAASRLDWRPALIALTLAHHLAGAVWIGGIPYLLVILRRSPDSGTLARITGRFSTAAIVSVSLIGGSGLGLSFFYVGSAGALKGTIYGIMLVSKVLLTMLLLGLGALNFRIVHAARRGLPLAWPPLQRFAEVEAGIGFTILLAAASLTSSPPAIDVRGDIVTGTEIARRLAPEWPRLRTPRASDLSPATPLNAEIPTARIRSFVPGETGSSDSPADIAWSEYNHHYAGLVMLSIGAASLIAHRFAPARHWPLLFLVLAFFILVRADAENWPLGPRGFWESFQVAEVAQHRIFVLLIVVFAVFECGVQTNRLSANRAGLVFPGICAVGGALLLTHSHSLVNVKQEFLAELSHIPLAILGIVAGWSRWLEIRLGAGRLRLLAWIWPLCFLLVGSLLLNYRES